MAFLDILFNRKPSPDAFAALFESAARKAGFKGEMHYNPRDFRLDYGESAFFNLHNAYREYCNARGPGRRKALQGYIAALCDNQRSQAMPLDDARPLLLPVVRSLGTLEEVRLHHLRTDGHDSDFHPAYLPLGADAAVLLAIDHPESTATLVEGPDRSWGIRLEEGIAIALTNLRDSTADRFIQRAAGVFQGAWDDGYDTSRILLPDVLERLPLKGRPVFMIPTRELLLVTGDRDGQGLASLVELSLEAMEKGRILSADLYCYENAKVVPYRVHNPLLKARLERLRKLYTQSEYDAQKQALDLMNEDNAVDLFVANYLLFASPQDPEQVFSLGTWTRGVDTLLPVTDRLMLVRPEGDSGNAQTRMVAWDQALELLGDYLEPVPGHYPPRYRTLGFPEPSRAELLDELG